MTHERPIPLDVAIVGGGPAGIAAGLELSKSSNLRMALFEGDPELLKVFADEAHRCVYESVG